MMSFSPVYAVFRNKKNSIEKKESYRSKQKKSAE